jgi:hypothetical protein
LSGRPCDPLNGGQHFAHRIAAAIAAIGYEAVAALLESAQRENVNVGKIADVNVVANASAVWSGIVGAIDRDFRPQPERCFAGSFDEVRRFARDLADLPCRIGTGDIEIA